MLLGCCHCAEESVESVPSIPSESTPPPSESVSSVSESIIPPETGVCGTCYNLPGTWRVNVPGIMSATFELHPTFDPLVHSDCRSLFSGSFLLQSEPVPQLTTAARVLLGLTGPSPLETVCALWHSTERAPNIIIESGRPECSSPAFSGPRWELVAQSMDKNNPSGCGETIFTLFLWWVQRGAFTLPASFAMAWEWRVLRVLHPVTGKCIFQNCVQCFNADYIVIPYVIDPMYILDATPPKTSDLSVCPA